MIDFVLMDEFRYSFDANHNRWVPNWRALAEEDCPRVYIHPETPATGASLMQNVLTFKMLKLTNSFKTASKSAQAILVSTMRRYVPRVMVVESANGVYFDYKLREEFYFPETEFMAVSQYRNKQITKLKIDANPFASAYRSEGLHGQAKRRRIESKTASEDWKDWITPEDGPPSNNSSLEEPGINSDEPDAENNSSSSEFVDEPSPEESVISDEQQANGKNPASPCQTGLRKEVSDAHNSIQDGTHKQENSSTVSQVIQIQLTNQTSESESQLSCGESPEWIWGFDEQMSLRYASENQMEGIVKQGDRPGNAAGKMQMTPRTKLPKLLPTLRSTEGRSSKDNEETVETEPVKEPTVNQVDTLSSQPNDTICDDNSKTEQLCSSDATAQSDAASSCLEEAEKPSITCNNSPKPQTINSHTDSILSRFRSAAGLLSVIGQEVSRLACSDSGKSSVTPAKRSAGPKNKKDSSLNALIQMCSEAEGSLGSRAYLPRSVRPWGTVSRDIFSKNVDGTPASQDISSRESEEESGGFQPLPAVTRLCLKKQWRNQPLLPIVSFHKNQIATSQCH
ncbi:T-box transcription factor tbx3 [Desmophyllum pertusum]|uniref:T-box transcription factor tbx3 n=1 Tax=Desmophyllum pertusum TaxID=174260 RepID=A0A9W9ZWT6_9CNID|nr:T-box transcription factor tbx3 [Desmophyllum pertusum]